jgi:predicted ArsR family transcriptional regulator
VNPIERANTALSSATRRRIFGVVCKASSPIDAAAAAEECGIDVSAARRHLAVLEAAALVDEVPARTGTRGRPRRVYSPGPLAERFVPRSGYERLAALLAEALESGDDPVEVGRRSAPKRVRRDGDPLDAVMRDLSVNGFDPERVTSASRTEIVLGRCPYASVAVHAPATVCALHGGLLEGICAASRVNAVPRLIPRDPRRAGCRVVFDVAVEAETPPPRRRPRR